MASPVLTANFFCPASLSIQAKSIEITLFIRMNMISNVMRILIVRNTLMFNLFLPSHFEGIKGNLNALVIIMMNLWF